jgi:cytochrome bd-type quinol oxidase subunit 2
LGFLFAGYLVLAGLDYGVAVSASRRGDLDRLAPFFLGNEVWLVAAVGLLFGAFPLAEGSLLGEYRAPIAVALAGVVLVTASYGLRIFSRSAQWDTTARVGGVLAAIGWGATIGAIGQGGRFHLSLLVIASAVAMLALLAAHGWAFLRRRWPVLAVTSLGLAGSVFWAGAKVDLTPAGDSTLAVVAPVAWVVIPLLLLLQGATWWIFRGLPPGDSVSRGA